MVIRIDSLCLFVLISSVLCAEEPAKFAPTRWEETIKKFEAQDKESPPPADGALFIGSSSIRRWDLKKWFPEHEDAINRGFGGSHMADSTHYADRIAINYQPRVIVVYAGDNDLAGGKTPQRVLDDYQAFVKKVHAELPKTRIVFVAVKPSIARWKLIEKVRAANALVKKEAAGDARLAFVDIDTPMIGEEGQPRIELFAKDGLHLSDAGYKMWSDLVCPHLEAK